MKGGYLSADCKLWTSGSSGDQNQAQPTTTDVHYKILSIDSEKSENPKYSDWKPTVVAELIKYTPIETVSYTKGDNYYGNITSTNENYKTANTKNDDGYYYVYKGIK